MISRIIFLVCVALVIQQVVVLPCNFERHTVIGSSMEPTLIHKDKMLTMSKAFGINRYDIVVIRVDGFGYKNGLVKRVIGIPGDTLEFKNEKVYCNGKELETKFMDESKSSTDSSLSTVTLGADEYFVLGDHRTVSEDSRFFGPIKEENIEGVVIWISR